MNRALLLAISLALVSACSKEDAPPAPPAPASAAATATAPASASASPVEPTTASASAAAPAAAAASAPAPVVASATALPASPAKPAAKGAPTCGDKPLPPCPLYAWMKANTSAAMSAEDFDALAVALDKTVTFAPAGYTN
jgi:hypothetical protein